MLILAVLIGAVILFGFLIRLINEPGLSNLIVVDELSTKKIVTLTEDENLLSALV